MNASGVRLRGEHGFAWVIGLGPIDTPGPFAVNSSGQDVVVTSPAVGHTRVQFLGLGTMGFNGNVQVVATGEGAARCKALDWSAGVVDVLCHAPGGAPVDAPFLVIYDDALRTSPGPAGFVRSVDAFASHDPPPTHSHNPLLDQVNSILRTGIGRYEVRFRGLGAENGTVQVTAVGADAAYCKSDGWSFELDELRRTVFVVCFDAAGNPADSQFSAQFVGKGTGEEWDRAFALAHDPVALSYVPVSENQHVSATSSFDSISAGRTGLGRYFVHYPMPPWHATMPMVTANAPDNVHCKPAAWASDGTPGDAGTMLSVNCFDPLGNPVDARFSTTYLHKDPPCRTPGCRATEHLSAPLMPVTEDNPRLTGFVEANGLNWSIDGALNESYGGAFSFAIEADRPILRRGVEQFAFDPQPLPGGARIAAIFRPQLTTSLPPWVALPGDCTSVTSSPDCTRFNGTTLPFFGPALYLPPDHSYVRVGLTRLAPNPNDDTLVNEVFMKLSDEVPLVPIHIHVIQGPNGQIPEDYYRLFQKPTDAATAFALMQEFDQGVVAYGPTPIARSISGASVSASAGRAMTDRRDLFNPDERTFMFTVDSFMQEQPIYADDVLGQCGVKLRLETVSFIHQSAGWEQELITREEFGTADQPGGTVIACNNPSASGLAKALIAAYESAGAAPGIHVLVGGTIKEPDREVGGVLGLACRTNDFVYLDGGSRGGGSPHLRLYDFNTALHEIAHVLGVDTHSTDIGNLMTENDGGVQLLPHQCADVVVGAERVGR